MLGTNGLSRHRQHADAEVNPRCFKLGARFENVRLDWNDWIGMGRWEGRLDSQANEKPEIKN
jgi:hypothetical protein